MKKIKKGDEVVVITGADKGKRGQVLKVSGNKVVVSGVQMVQHHVKPDPQKEIQGGIVAKEAAIDVSNVAIWDADSSRPSRVRIIVQDGKKVRQVIRTGKVLS